MEVEKGENEARLYEVSFLLIPALAEESADKEAEAIRAELIKEGATILYEGKPKAISLAYPISKSIEHKRTVYESAYFGWFAFEKKAGILDLKAILDKNGSVIRFLIINTIKEAYTTPKQRREVLRPRAPLPEKEVAPEITAVEESTTPVDEVELDKEIEHLLV
jgi:ribosomal protein S6